MIAIIDESRGSQARYGGRSIDKIINPKPHEHSKLNCSFCGRSKPQTNLLIAGLDAHICDRCIEQAHGIVSEEAQEETGGLNLSLNHPKKSKRF